MKIKVYVNFILIKSLGTLGTVRVNITESKGDSIITSRLGGRWVYKFFLILRDGKLGGGWYLIKVRDLTVKKFSMNYLYN